ncbi:hypothetical protein AC578_10512 [Pseudocercospora eumusae]|uniref:Uncharacterized protein n=1 Tax=Pseudocercospora eumusae TaxID=321146 RepID=A0A139H8E2_9PEZI|nr:hypothetical protein AC578_10512 [Pseudocercospora eumusae]
MAKPPASRPDVVLYLRGADVDYCTLPQVVSQLHSQKHSNPQVVSVKHFQVRSGTSEITTVCAVPPVREANGILFAHAQRRQYLIARQVIKQGHLESDFLRNEAHMSAVQTTA